MKWDYSDRDCGYSACYIIESLSAKREVQKKGNLRFKSVAGKYIVL